MTHLRNLPHRKSKIGLIPKADHDSIAIRLEGTNFDVYRLTLTDSFLSAHPNTVRAILGGEIAALVIIARDIGYEQAIQDVRDLLGIKSNGR